jgi:SfnB family sulfur acquisition oxidoreductase
MSAPETTRALARVIRDDAEAIAVAHALADRVRPGAAERDREGRVDRETLEALAASGLLAITVPREYGGADVSWATLTEVFRILASADPAVAQLPQNHFVFVQVLIDAGRPEQQEFFHAEVLRGARFGNALSERGTKHAMDFKTRIAAPAGDDEDQRLVLDGRKYYCTGAVTADWIPVFAVDHQDRLVVPYVERHADGVEVDSDWSAMGQRATQSGTTTFTSVRVPAERVVPLYETFDRPSIGGAFAQIMHAAIDVGIAANALEDAAEYVRARTRPWFESDSDRAADDPRIILEFGQLATSLHAAEALLARAGDTIDAARADLNERTAAAASLAVAEAKAFGGETAVEIASELFSLAGTSATDERWDLHRHWRNARTHTLHDPNRWKYHHNGNFVLNRVLPPASGLL